MDEQSEAPELSIAIVCRTDRRSAKAVAVLAQHGFEDAHVVRDAGPGGNGASCN